MLAINPPEFDGPRLADVCEQVKGCLNGDIFKFGPVIAGILIAAEILFWVSFSILVVKRFKKKK
jgi:hypothetical protein